MPDKIAVVVDNRLRFPADLPADFAKQLKELCTHKNPEHAKKRAMGLWVGHIPSNIATWQEHADGSMSVPRGCSQGVKDIASKLRRPISFVDERVSFGAEWEPFQIEPRKYQREAMAACLQYEQGIVKAPTGSGKTFMGLAVLPELRQRALVIVRDRNLLDQWLMRAQDGLGLKKRDIGIIGGGKRKIGDQLTISLQQSLYSDTFPMETIKRLFGAVIVDEVQDAAARTVQETVDAFPARVRLGFSADHTRRDRKEFLTMEQFGRVIYEVDKKSLEDIGAVCPVVVRLVPTDFVADWYARAPSAERDFTRLVSEMTADEPRCQLVRQVVSELVQAGTVPALVFTNRREHAIRLAEQELPADGVPSGLLLGSVGNAQQFEESKALLISGALKIAVGTYKAVGQGIDIPNVLAGVCATPIGSNRQYFNQVRGRICRVVPGKSVGHLYYLWDRNVFPETPRNLLAWNDGLVEVFDDKRNGWVTFR